MIKLFEMPIYSWSESEFMKKIEQHKKKFLEKYCDRTPIQTIEETYRDFYNNKKQY